MWGPTFYMFKDNNNGNTRARCEICPKLIIKIPGRRHWRRSGVVNFEVKCRLADDVNLIDLIGVSSDDIIGLEEKDVKV